MQSGFNPARFRSCDNENDIRAKQPINVFKFMIFTRRTRGYREHCNIDVLAKCANTLGERLAAERRTYNVTRSGVEIKQGCALESPNLYNTHHRVEENRTESNELAYNNVFSPNLSCNSKCSLRLFDPHILPNCKILSQPHSASQSLTEAFAQILPRGKRNQQAQIQRRARTL
jgi:hypothetical protein